MYSEGEEETDAKVSEGTVYKRGSKERGGTQMWGVVDGAQRGRCATVLKPAGIGKQPREIENVFIK